MIRKAKPSDLDAIVDLAVESVTTVSPIPQLQIDKVAMRETAQFCLNPAHFLMVSEIDGVVVGAVGAQVSQGFWFRGKSCSTLLHYSRVPGEWVKLMREYSRWVKSRPGIKIAVVELEDCHGDNMVRFLDRLGFARVSRNVTYVR